MPSASLRSAGCVGVLANSDGGHIDMGADTMNVLGRGLTMYSKSSRSAFTLVELLVVISIIGVLVAITVPSVMAVRVSVLQGAVKFEVDAFADAVEQYRTKYGEYPPDGSSWPIMEAHLRRAFPEILQSELAFLRPANTPTQLGIDRQVMSRAEAIVFFLGGFSEDKQKPFSGKGGPFKNEGTLAAPIWTYNPSRDNGFYEFESGRLLASVHATLPLPTYASYQSEAPILYFDSRTYVVKRTTDEMLYNSFDSPVFGRAMPLLIPSPNMAITARDPRAHIPNFENSKTFQIISPGLDSGYGFDPSGNLLFTSRGDGITVNFATTPFYTAVPAIKKFAIPANRKNIAYDNSANCIEERIFGMR